MANSLDGTIHQLVREWITDGLCWLPSQNGPRWAGGGTMLFCGRPARRLSLSCPSQTLSALLMFLQSWGPPRVPSRVQKKSQKAEKTEEGRLTAALLGKMTTSSPRTTGQEAEDSYFKFPRAKKTVLWSFSLWTKNSLNLYCLMNYELLGDTALTSILESPVCYPLPRMPIVLGYSNIYRERAMVKHT